METFGLLLVVLAALGILIVGASIFFGIITIGLLVFTKIGRSAIVEEITTKLVNMIFSDASITFRRKGA